MNSHLLKDRWALYIDIEGFGHVWDEVNPEQAIKSLRHLIEAIFIIGRLCYPNDSKRLFAHQIGDGFFVLSDFHEDNLERAITIAVAIMRHVSESGLFARAAIAEGDNADITSCYPEEVLEHAVKGTKCISLSGGGLMTLFSVMGTALIRAHELAQKSPQGPLLIIEASKIKRIPEHIPFRLTIHKGKRLLIVDWIHIKSDLLSNIQDSIHQKISKSIPQAIRLKYHTIGNMEKRLAQYCVEHKRSLKKEWIEKARQFLNISSTKNLL